MNILFIEVKLEFWTAERRTEQGKEKERTNVLRRS